MTPRSRVPVVRSEGTQRIIDLMGWDVLGGQAAWAMTNVRNLALPQWKRLAEKPENRCLIPCTEFAGWTPAPYDLRDGKKPIKGETWFQVKDHAPKGIDPVEWNKADDRARKRLIRIARD